jgi:beta-1,4-N-acetylglucosaminyltransferase
MIFVTVGTTLPFDELIETMDALVRRGNIAEQVVCQIGVGRYRPKRCEFFAFRPTLAPWYEEASLVVAHGGTGTVLELLRMKKPFVAVANPRAADNHQAQFLAKLESLGSVLWCRDLDRLHQDIQRARTYRLKDIPYETLALALMREMERNSGPERHNFLRRFQQRFMDLNSRRKG